MNASPHVVRVVAGVSFVWSLLLPAVQAQTLMRGPYLQNENPTAISIRWRTSANAASVVRFGTSAGSLDQAVTNSTPKSNHEIRLTGLAADTKYFYSVGTTAGTLASGADYYFLTAPTGAKPTRIWVLGDAGTANSSQRAVRDAYYNFTGTRHTDLWLMLGDNAYQDGTDAEFQAALYDIYPTMLRKSALWPTLGNHDAGSASSSSQTGPYYDMFTLPKAGEAGGVASGTEAFYSFDYGNIHFVCLNSQDVSRSANGTMLTWLRADLENNTKEWLIAFWHHPPYSKGSHNSDTETALIEMRQNALPILESYGADLVLCGHSHAYERSKLIDGHYGSSSTLVSSMVVNGTSGRADSTGAYTKSAGNTPNEGTVYAVAGASGSIEGGALNHPAMFLSLNVLGSLVLDVDGGRLDAQYIDSTGARRDYFTIQKSGVANQPPTISLTAPTNGATFTAPATVTLCATAADSDGTVTQVVFFAGSTLLGAAAVSPFDLTWNNVPAGTHSLTAVATDNLGATRTSVAVPITVNGVGGAVTISFQQGTSGYSGMVDTKLRNSKPTTAYGSSTTLEVDGSPYDVSLLKWNLASIPPSATVTAVTLTFSVSDASASGYELYALKRTWSESQATWTRAASGVNWQVAGANGANDRETTVLGTVTGSAVGTITVNLNASGIAKVQSWINTPANNFGFILLDYSNTDGLDLRSRETGTVSQRPKLTITHQ